VLDVSHVLTRADGSDRRGATLQVKWSELDEDGWTDALRAEGTRTVGSVVRRELPQRLADALIAASGVAPATSLAQLRREERSRLIETLTKGVLPWTGDEGYKKAEVTGGGISLAEVDPRTLESRRAGGLYICGEVLDAFGPIGGYNFLWAWATGRAAGLAAGSS
jgi:predicted flavoprotein YhiN